MTLVNTIVHLKEISIELVIGCQGVIFELTSILITIKRNVQVKDLDLIVVNMLVFDYVVIIHETQL